MRPQLSGHLALLAGRRRDGQPVFEVVPARSSPGGLWELLGTPALAEGCAEGDVVAVHEEGEFEVRERGGNVAVVSYAKQGQTLERHVAPLERVLNSLQGTVECPDDGRWIVATVPVSSGFSAIEAAMSGWAAAAGCDWSFGNVYDQDGQPLNWW